MAAPDVARLLAALGDDGILLTSPTFQAMLANDYGLDYFGSPENPVDNQGVTHYVKGGLEQGVQSSVALAPGGISYVLLWARDGLVSTLPSGDDVNWYPVWNKLDHGAQRGQPRLPRQSVPFLRHAVAPPVVHDDDRVRRQRRRTKDDDRHVRVERGLLPCDYVHGERELPRERGVVHARHRTTQVYTLDACVTGTTPATAGACTAFSTYVPKSSWCGPPPPPPSCGKTPTGKCSVGWRCCGSDGWSCGLCQ